MPGQVPTQAPTKLSINITVLGTARQVGGVLWIGRQDGLQLFSPAVADSYNWSTSNTSTLINPCLSAAGGYLYVPASCLASDRAYVFGLTVQKRSISGYARVSGTDILSHICVFDLRQA
jgi:hypothetical protein